MTGDRADLIQVWNAQTCQHLKTLRGHQGPITVSVYIEEKHLQNTIFVL